MKNITLWLFTVASLVMFACSDNDKVEMLEHDPNKDIVISRFFPDSGGIAEKFIIEGSNFGSDTSKIKLFFNEKRAVIITVKGDKLYALAPRLPGESCDIILEIGDKKVQADKTFKYLARMTVSTIAGSRGANGGKFLAGSLATAAFGNLRGVVADRYGNLFVSMYGGGGINGVALVNIPGNVVSWAANVTGGAVAWNSGTINKNTDVVYFISNSSGSVLELDPLNLWSPRTRRIKRPSKEQQLNEGMVDFQPAEWLNTHSVAWHSGDGRLYTRQRQGRIGWINPETWVGQFFERGNPDYDTGKIDPLGESDSYVAFNPLEPDWLYISMQHKHCIRRFNIKTYEFQNWAGTPGGTRGWKDGVGGDALFNAPKEIAFDQEGSMYVADMDNNVIRKVSKERVVSTLTGIPGRRGAVDGPPHLAEFDRPWGITVDNEGNIFVAENPGNNMVRKITLE